MIYKLLQRHSWPGLNISSFHYLFTTSQIHQVEFAAELLFCLSVLLFDVYQEDTVTPGAVLVHVCRRNDPFG